MKQLSWFVLSPLSISHRGSKQLLTLTFVDGCIQYFSTNNVTVFTYTDIILHIIDNIIAYTCAQYISVLNLLSISLYIGNKKNIYWRTYLLYDGLSTFSSTDFETHSKSNGGIYFWANQIISFHICQIRSKCAQEISKPFWQVNIRWNVPVLWERFDNIIF